MLKETSKRLLLCVLLYCAVALTVILIVWSGGEAANAPAMASIYSAPAAVVIGFYEWKARGENLIKIRNAGVPDDLLKAWLKHKLKQTAADFDLEDDNIAG